MDFEKLQKIIAEVMDIDPEEITPDAKFVDDLGADSLDVLQIITEVETEFDISISDEDAENIRTVQDAVNEISKML